MDLPKKSNLSWVRVGYVFNRAGICILWFRFRNECFLMGYNLIICLFCIHICVGWILAWLVELWFRFLDMSSSLVKSIMSLFLKLDISKAFDSVSWSFLLEVLSHLGFGMTWCNLISNLPSTSSTRVMLNGVPGDLIQHQCGLRQGDPLWMCLIASSSKLGRMGFYNPSPQGFLDSDCLCMPMMLLSL